MSCQGSWNARISAGAANWQVQLTVAMGNAVDNPDLLLQPYQLLELMPLLAASRRHDVRRRDPGHDRFTDADRPRRRHDAGRAARHVLARARWDSWTSPRWRHPSPA